MWPAGRMLPPPALTHLYVFHSQSLCNVVIKSFSPSLCYRLWTNFMKNLLCLSKNVQLFDTFVSNIDWWNWTHSCSISNFFLILTFCVYCVLPELRAPTFGKITMIFIVALFTAYLVIFTVFLKVLTSFSWFVSLILHLC